VGAMFFFNKMLRTVSQEAPGVTNPRRQLEVFTLDGKTFLRIGPVGEEDAGEGRATVEISDVVAHELIMALQPVAE
jgi:hypothetical protein